MSNEIIASEIFKPEELEQIYMLAEAGHTEEFIRAFYKISRRKWYALKQSDPAFVAEFKKWKERADEKVEKALYERAIGYSHPDLVVKVDKDGCVHKVPTWKHYPPDPTACVFWLKNRRPKDWRDKVEHDVSGEIAHNHTVKVNPEETKARLNLLVEEQLNDALK